MAAFCRKACLSSRLTGPSQSLIGVNTPHFLRLICFCCCLCVKERQTATEICAQVAFRQVPAIVHRRRDDEQIDEAAVATASGDQRLFLCLWSKATPPWFILAVQGRRPRCCCAAQLSSPVTPPCVQQPSSHSLLAGSPQGDLPVI